MRNLLWTAVLVLLPVAAAAQDAALPIPATVKVDGVPAIPASMAERFATYGEFRSAELLTVHPTRREILIATTFGPRRHIHVVDGPGRARTQLTFGPAIQGGAIFEPTKGDYFVFRRDTGGGTESSQLFRFDVATRAVTMITDGKARNGGNAMVVSSRSGLLAFDSNRRTGKDRDIWVVDPANPSSQRMVPQITGNWFARDWSPDDRELLVEELVSTDERYLWRVDVKTGAKTALTPREKAPALWQMPRFAPDGRTIYAVSNSGGEFPRLWRGDIAASAWTPITAESSVVETYALSPDGRTIAVVFDRDASSVLELVDAASGKTRHVVKVPPGIVTRLEWRRTGQELLFNLASIHTQNDVYSVMAPTGAVERWTTSEVGGAHVASLPAPEIVRWKSFDGLTVSGILYRPPARFTGPRPVIINVHGGPAERERPRFIGRSAAFLNEQGIAVLYPNVRGSAGFGKAFLAADNGKLREHAVQDVGALLDWIAQQPALDKNRVMVTGPSYGGYVTYAAAVKYGDRIRAAVPAGGIADFVAYLEQTEPVRQPDRRSEYGDERDAETRAFLKELSPATHVARIRTPLLIVHGGKDPRVPLAQAQAMAKAVRANGVPVWMVVFEDEGHLMFANTANNDLNLLIWLRFVEEFLLK